MDNIKLSVIVPCLNEESYLTSSIENVIKACNHCKIEFEIIIVDDGSDDNTYIVAEDFIYKNINLPIKLFKNIKTSGLGSSYFKGVSFASGTHVTWIPGDNSHPYEGLLDTYNRIGNADIIIPFPINPEIRPLIRRIISKLYTFFVNFISGLNIPYYNGLSVYKIDLLTNVPNLNSSFAFQAEILVNSIYNGASYEISYTTIAERQIGHSKAFKVINILNVLKTLIRLIKLKLIYARKKI